MRRGTDRSRPCRSHKIRWLTATIRPKWYRPVLLCHMDSLSFKTEIWPRNRKKYVQILKNHIFWSVYPKIANNMSLDS
jgi:hypothetical protein